ncbi:MAG: hypothetical protein ABSG07_03220 [Terriglobales bacterium]|jgi:hypothetical protein
MSRQYYSQRKLKQKGTATLGLEALKELFLALYRVLQRGDRLQEFYGYECVDAGHVPGKAGDVFTFFLRKLRKNGLWPIEDALPSYSEEDLFDVIELIYDTVSDGIEEDGRFHNYNGCGWHYRSFRSEPAKSEFRTEINELLRDYDHGFELTEDGEILEQPDPTRIFINCSVRLFLLALRNTPTKLRRRH